MLRTSFLMLLAALILTGCQDTTKPNASTDTSTTPKNSDTSQVHAAIADAGDTDAIRQALQDNIHASGLQATVQRIVPTQMTGIYMATLSDLPPIFTDAQGKYLIQGDIVALGGARPVNVSANAMATVAKDALAAIDTSEMIIFPAKGETKAAIYAFTDPSCHYCQQLHKEIDKTTAAGIEVRYLAWPRSEQMLPVVTSVWCSSDRSAALTAAKLGQPVTPANCDNPVKKHIALGFGLGVSGTPAIFSESGHQLGGYLPSEDLVAAAIEHKNN